MSRKSKDWFLERVGNRVYRDDNGCDCNVCRSVMIHSKKEKNESSS